MNPFRFFGAKPNSAPQARERLQLLLSHERALDGRQDLVAVLREEILKVIAKHASIDRDKVKVRMAKHDTLSTLEVDLEIRAPSSGGNVTLLAS